MTRDFLMDTHPDGIINIVDATNVDHHDGVPYHAAHGAWYSDGAGIEYDG